MSKIKIIVLILLLAAMNLSAQTYSGGSGTTDYRFQDLQLDADSSFSYKFAILEMPFLDRCLHIKTNEGIATPIYRGSKVIGYQTYISFIGNNSENTEYLTVYRENSRKITEDRIIPYYSFSITYENVEYLLNVVVDTAINRTGSVNWTTLGKEDRETLIDWEANPEAFPTYKFCLPIRVDEKGN